MVDFDFDALDANNINMEHFPASPEVPLEEKKLVVSEAIDSCLNLVGVSPIKRSKVSQKRYSNEKMHNVSEALATNIFNHGIDDNGLEENDENNLMQVLKEEFNATTERSKRMKILTIFKDWSFRIIQRHFSLATCLMIKIAKKIAEEKGILSDRYKPKEPSIIRERSSQINN